MKINQFTKNYIQRFMDPEDEGGTSPLDVLDADLPGNTEENTETQETPETPEAKPQGFDADALAASLKGVLEPLVKAQNQPKQEEQKQLTAEEARKMLNFWEPDDDLVAKLNNVETAKEALALIRDGMLKQNVTIVRAMLEEALGGVHSQYSPLLSAHAEAQAAATEGRFNAKYTQLADPTFKPIRDAVMQSFITAKKQFKTEDEAFAALAKGVESVIQRVNPEFKLTAESTPSAKKPGNPNALPSARPGAGKGGGGSPGAKGGSAPKGNLALSILNS